MRPIGPTAEMKFITISYNDNVRTDDNTYATECINMSDNSVVCETMNMDDAHKTVRAHKIVLSLATT